MIRTLNCPAVILLQVATHRLGKPKASTLTARQPTAPHLPKDTQASTLHPLRQGILEGTVNPRQATTRPLQPSLCMSNRRLSPGPVLIVALHFWRLCAVAA